MNVVDALMRLEDGALSNEETLDAFAALIADGTINSLQGAYGRHAHALIANGYLTPDGEVTVWGRMCAREIDDQ